MIETTGLTKRFEDIVAVNDITTVIKDGAVFGLIGSNGAGKSTFLRLISGIYKPDEGSVTIDGEAVFENNAIKRRCFYISDDQYFFPNTTPDALRMFYANLYPNFNHERFFHLLKSFDLDKTRKISTFSKGMKKQVSVICAVSSQTDYIFADETFDGLDPVARQAVKSLFAADIADRGVTPIVASHNLRELEDICDHVGVLHKGGILFSRDLEDLMAGAHKVQAAFAQPVTKEDLPGLEILRFEQRGSLITMTVNGPQEQIEEVLNRHNPLFMELLPLSLEEIFISETEVVGYDIKKLLF